MAKARPAEIQKSLAGLSYPASKEELVMAARSGGASDDVLDDLNDLPDRQYDGPPDVMSELSDD